MTRLLAYDTETTGLPLFEQPSEHPDQPHLVQLAAKLIDVETRKCAASINLIIEPKNWAIPEEVSKIHGITHAHALCCGVDEATAVKLLLQLWDCADYRVAHNETFDARIVRIALKRYSADLAAYDADEWKDGKAECTARMSTPILNLPPTARMVAARRNHPKTPNLGEAFEFFTGRKLDGAHDALVDVDACIECYFAMLDRAARPKAVA